MGLAYACVYLEKEKGIPFIVEGRRRDHCSLEGSVHLGTRSEVTGLTQGDVSLSEWGRQWTEKTWADLWREGIPGAFNASDPAHNALMAAYWAAPAPVMMGSLGHIAFNATHAAFNAGLVGSDHAVLWTIPGALFSRSSSRSSGTARSRFVREQAPRANVTAGYFSVGDQSAVAVVALAS